MILGSNVNGRPLCYTTASSPNGNTTNNMNNNEITMENRIFVTGSVINKDETCI